MNAEKVITKNLWSIIHKQLATDHYSYNSTIVEANSKEDALEFFNSEIADNHYFLQENDIDHVYPFTYFKRRSN